MADNISNPFKQLEELLSNATLAGEIKVQSKKINSSSGCISDIQKVSEGEGFISQETQDKISNRNLREKIAYKISIMMLCELLFIFALLLGIFVVPYLNALAPVLCINLPPLVLTITLITATVFIFGLLNKWQSGLAIAVKILLVIAVFATINLCPRISWSFDIQPIVLSKDIIQLILLVTETIFVKTTILAGFIITGLFKDLKSEKLGE